MRCTGRPSGCLPSSLSVVAPNVAWLLEDEWREECPLSAPLGAAADLERLSGGISWGGGARGAM